MYCQGFSLINLITVLIVILFLSLGLTNAVIFGLTFFHAFTIILCFLLLILYFSKSISTNTLLVTTDFLFTSFFILVFTLVSIFHYGFQVNETINLFIFMTFGYFLVNAFSLDILIKIYKYFVALIIFFAYFQFLSFVIGSEFLFTYSFLGRGGDIGISNGLIRLTSLASEPANLCKVLSLALGLSIASFMGVANVESFWGKKISANTIVVILLSFSSIGYIYIMLFFIFLLFSSKTVSIKYKFIGVVSLAFLFFFALSVEEVYRRIQDVLSVNNVMDYSDNLSVFAILSNLNIVIKVLTESPFLGRGLYTHQYSYDEFIYGIYNSSVVRMELNKDDASSLYLRLLSECGIVGFVSFVGVFIYNIIKSLSINVLISITFVSLLLFSLRSGDVNTPFFWFLFFLCFKMKRDLS